jgi:hypothetical protein
MELTQEQIDFLDDCTMSRYKARKHWLSDKTGNYYKGVWTLNKETGLVDIEGNFDSYECIRYNSYGTSCGIREAIKSKDFKGIKFGVVTGYFYCSNMGLESLEGAPIKVLEDFDCSGNKLTSLTGAPKEVGGDFYCSVNKLNDLKGAPSVVGGDFLCIRSGIKSLAGAPKETGGIFDCSKNKLTSLKWAPKKARSFQCQENLLTDLVGAPSILSEGDEYSDGRFDCSHNQLTTLKGAPKIVRSFHSVGNPLKDLEGVPHIKDYYCRRGSGFPRKFSLIYEIMEEHKVEFKEAVDIFEQNALVDIIKRREAVDRHEEEIMEIIKSMK